VNENVIVDAGPVVAWLNRDDEHHLWAKEQFGRLKAPLLSCESVLSEASLLLQRGGGDASAIPALVRRGVFQIALAIQDEAAALEKLMQRYHDVPMSLADACLVRMSELRDHSMVFTLDSDFRIYRRHGRLVIPTLLPPEPHERR